MPSILLKDTAIEDYGLVLLDGPPYLGGFTVARDHTSWPGRMGTVPSPHASSDARVLRFVADRAVNSPAARIALLDWLADELTGQLEVRYADVPDRVLRGYCRVFEAEVPLPPRWLNLAPRIVVEIVCPIAHRWDRHAQSRVLGTTPTAIPVGTLPHGGQLMLSGTAAGALTTPVTLRYRGISGAVLDTLTITPSLLAGEYAIVDLDLRTITKVTTAGARSAVYSWKTGGAWFRVAPRHALRSLDAWPTLELTGGAGLYYFRRNWKN